MNEDVKIQKKYLCKDFSNIDLENQTNLDYFYIRMIEVFFLIQEESYKEAERELFSTSNSGNESSLFYLNLILLSLRQDSFDPKLLDKYIERGLASLDLLGKRWLCFELYKMFAAEENTYASSMLSQSLEIDSNFLPAKLESICLMDFYEKPKEVINGLEILRTELDCPNIVLLNSLGHAYLVDDKWIEAEKCFKEVVELEDVAESYFGLAMIYHFYNDNPNLEQAIDYYNQALVVNPYYYEARVGYLKLLAEKNEQIRFREILNDTINVELNSFENLLDIIFLLVEEEKYEFIHDIGPMLVELESNFNLKFLYFLIQSKRDNKLSYTDLFKRLDSIGDLSQRNLFETILKKIFFHDEV